MDSLHQERCIACNKKAMPVTEAETPPLLAQIPDWQLVEVEGIRHLERIYKFRDFRTALEFTHRVGEAAEAEGHHPAILLEWGKVKVSWWTHAIANLHRNDFVMAAKTDRIAGEFDEQLSHC
jgi:4a-hydroxytetrahydrobiopterin dehydratase